MRAALADSYDSAHQEVRGLYEALAAEQTAIDPRNLAARSAAVDSGLAPNDAKRFRPAEADTLADMAASDHAPLSDVLATRSGLTDDIRAARASGQNQAARIGGQYVNEIDEFLGGALDPQTAARFDAAKTARRDVGERFERPGTAHADVLRTREGGAYALDDSAVPQKYAQPDSGKLSDLKALLQETNGDPRARESLADTILAEVQARGLAHKSQALAKFMKERGTLLSEFPGLETKLQAARDAAGTVESTIRTAQNTERTLTTPGRSPEASYLKYSDDRTLDSIRSVISAPDPRAAARTLIKSAGTDTAPQDLRAALWEEVKRTGRNSAPDSTGTEVWNGRKLKDLFDDPKFSAVADELWADDPEDLASIREVFSALAGSEGSIKAKAPGTSGTGQVSGRYDPALTTASVASRARSVNRGQLSPTIAVVDVLSTFLRRRSSQVQARAIEQVTSEVINNPGLAADLLERFNPATADAHRRMLTQKYGVRASTLINMLDDTQSEDPVLEALQE